MTNGFEDIEKKIKEISKKTSAQIDKRILDDAFGVLEQVPRSEQPSERPIFVAAAAVIIITVILGLFFIFNRPSKPKEKIVKTSETPIVISLTEPNKPKDAEDKLQAEMEKIIALARVGDVNGLQVILNEGSEPAKLLAADYLNRIQNQLDSRISQKKLTEPQKSVKVQLSDANEHAVETTDLNQNQTEAIIDNEIPRIVSVNPPSGSQMSLVGELEIVFDRPMDANDFEVVSSGRQKDYPAELGVFYNYIEYIADENKFILPLKLPNNWNGSIRFQNFVSADGVKAEPFTASYNTLENPFSESLLTKFRKSLDSQELISLLQKVKDSRLRLNSLSETVYTIMWYGKGQEKTHEATFKFQGSNQFYADISSIMEIPFYLACDGNNCWLYSSRKEEEKLKAVAFEDINEMSVDICNPFGIKDADIHDVIERYNLQYEGIEPIDSQQCYLIRSWQAGAENIGTNCSISSWWFDMQTFMPVQIFFDYGGDNSKLVRFIYHGINEQMSDEVFTYHSLTNLEPNLPEPLDEGYNIRFLNCIDGSTNGRMSVRWGMKGPKGTSSSGLN